MHNLKFLEFQRMLRELQFVESDYLYQSEIMKISDNEFLRSVDTILNQFPELKEIYYKKQEQVLESIDMGSTEVIESIPNIEVVESPEAKKLYRDIVKTTHPDKIKIIS